MSCAWQDNSSIVCSWMFKFPGVGRAGKGREKLSWTAFVFSSPTSLLIPHSVCSWLLISYIPEWRAPEMGRKKNHLFPVLETCISKQFRENSKCKYIHMIKYTKRTRTVQTQEYNVGNPWVNWFLDMCNTHANHRSDCPNLQDLCS